jgi:hypothetical protein
LYVENTLLQWLAQDLQDMAAELGPFIQEEHAMMGQRHLAWHRHMADPDQPRIGDGMMGRAKRPGRHQRRTSPREAGDAVDTGGLNGLGEGHRRQNGGQPPRQPRRAHPRGAEQEDIMVTTPASLLPSHLSVQAASSSELEAPCVVKQLGRTGLHALGDEDPSASQTTAFKIADRVVHGLKRIGGRMQGDFALGG